MRYIVGLVLAFLVVAPIQYCVYLCEFRVYEKWLAFGIINLFFGPIVLSVFGLDESR